MVSKLTRLSRSLSLGLLLVPAGLSAQVPPVGESGPVNGGGRGRSRSTPQEPSATERFHTILLEGRRHQERREWPRAVEAYLKAITLIRENPWLKGTVDVEGFHKELSYSYLQWGADQWANSKFEAALHSAQEAYNHDKAPSNRKLLVEVLSWTAVKRMEREDFEGALRLAARARDLSPELPWVQEQYQRINDAYAFYIIRRMR